MITLKKKKMKRLNVNFRMMLAITVILTLSYSLMAQPQRRSMQTNRPDGNFMYFFPELTEEQKSQIEEINLETLKEVQPLRDELQVNNAELNTLVKKDDPDMDAISKLVEENSGIRTRIQMLNIEGRIKIRSLLTEDQKVRFDAGATGMRQFRDRSGYMPQRGLRGSGRFFPNRGWF